MRTIYDVDTIECNRVTREQICLTGMHYKFTYCKEYPLVPAQMLSIRASLSLYSYNDENLNKLVRVPKPCMRPNVRPRAELAFPYCSRTMWHPVDSGSRFAVLRSHDYLQHRQACASATFAQHDGTKAFVSAVRIVLADANASRPFLQLLSSKMAASVATSFTQKATIIFEEQYIEL